MGGWILWGKKISFSFLTVEALLLRRANGRKNTLRMSFSWDLIEAWELWDAVVGICKSWLIRKSHSTSASFLEVCTKLYGLHHNMGCSWPLEKSLFSVKQDIDPYPLVTFSESHALLMRNFSEILFLEIISKANCSISSNGIINGGGGRGIFSA